MSLSFIEKVRDCFLIQHVTEVTSFRGENIGNTLDLIFTDDDLFVEDIKIESPLGKSDHGCVQFKCSIQPQKEECKKHVDLYEKSDYCTVN